MSVDVSVVIPVGSVDEELVEQLRALAGQDFAGRWELVCSLNDPDPTRREDLESSITRLGLDAAIAVTVVDSSDRRSAAHARNVGARAAASDLLAFCDGDDHVDPGWLSALVAALADHDAVGGHLSEGALVPAGQLDWRPPATPSALPTFLGFGYPVSANMGVRRDLFERAGGFREDLTRCEDIALGWRFIELGSPAVYVPDAVVEYRHRRGWMQLIRQHVLYGRGMSELLIRAGTPEPSAGGLLRANSQPVPHKGIAYVVRRGSLAIGRAIGIMDEWASRFRPHRSAVSA